MLLIHLISEKASFTYFKESVIAASNDFGVSLCKTILVSTSSMPLRNLINQSECEEAL